VRKFETLEYKGYLWEVVGKLPDRPDQPIEMLKSKYFAHLCLRKSGLLYLVQLIEDAEIIEETTDEETNEEEKKNE